MCNDKNKKMYKNISYHLNQRSNIRYYIWLQSWLIIQTYLLNLKRKINSKIKW